MHVPASYGNTIHIFDMLNKVILLVCYGGFLYDFFFAPAYSRFIQTNRAYIISSWKGNFDTILARYFLQGGTQKPNLSGAAISVGKVQVWEKFEDSVSETILKCPFPK